nr:hypothetical protein [Leptospira sp. mild_001]
MYYYNTEPTKVYNLEVEDNHTYIVGGDVTLKLWELTQIGV